MSRKLLLVAATYEEIQPLFVQQGWERTTYRESPGLDIVVTGVGMTATAYALGRQLHKPYSLILNVGIAGSFSREIALGSLVQVTSDTFSELGAEDGQMFLPIDTLGFGQANFTPPALSHPLTASLTQVAGITVNTVHGREEHIAQIRERLQVQTESMEGAAVFYAAMQAGVPVMQIRAISNYVEKRNREQWKIGLAIHNLNQWLMTFLQPLIMN